MMTGGSRRLSGLRFRPPDGPPPLELPLGFEFSDGGLWGQGEWFDASLGDEPTVASDTIASEELTFAQGAGAIPSEAPTGDWEISFELMMRSGSHVNQSQFIVDYKGPSHTHGRVICELGAGGFVPANAAVKGETVSSSTSVVQPWSAADQWQLIRLQSVAGMLTVVAGAFTTTAAPGAEEVLTGEVIGLEMTQVSTAATSRWVARNMVLRSL